MLTEIELITDALGERVDPSSPLDVWSKLENCVSLLGNAARIESEASKMKYIGYDTYMVFVNTSLEVALKRNQMRARKVPDAIVISNHKQVQKNIGLLQRIFGMSNFVVVDNNKVAEDVNPSVHKAIRRMVNKKPTSYQAVSWIKRELAKKRRR